MSNPYSGSAAGLNEDSAVTITEPADGDGLAAASVNTPLSKLADLVEYLRANTVKRTMAALGASSPSGQVGPVPYKIASTEAFDFYAALQTHSDPHPIAKYIPIGGDDGSGDSRSYYDTNGDIIITRGCYFVEGPAFARYWERSGTRTGAAYKFTFSIGGLIVQVKNAGAAGDTWADNAWDKTLTLDTSSGVQGDVLGVISGSTVGFGRPREVATAFPYAANWADHAGWVSESFRDASGVTRLHGLAQAAAGATTTMGTLATAFRPTAPRQFFVPVYVGGGATASVGVLDVDTTGVVTIQNLTANYTPGANDLVRLDGVSFP